MGAVQRDAGWAGRIACQQDLDLNRPGRSTGRLDFCANEAVLSLARELEVPFPLAAATDDSNAGITLRVVEMLAKRIRSGSRVAVLGLSYKPDTPVIEESQGLLLASGLVDRGFEVRVYDPQAVENARAVLGDSVVYAGSAQECVGGAESVVIATA